MKNKTKYCFYLVLAMVSTFFGLIFLLLAVFVDLFFILPSIQFMVATCYFAYAAAIVLDSES